MDQEEINFDELEVSHEQQLHRVHKTKIIDSIIDQQHSLMQSFKLGID